MVAEIEAKGGKALAAIADVTDQAAVERMAAATVERFGRIDILVNNAAGRPEKKLDEMTLADWRGVLAVILDGAFLTVKACLPHLKQSGAGRHRQHRRGVRARRHQAPRARRDRQGRSGRPDQGAGA